MAKARTLTQQDTISLKVTSPLGENALVMRSFEGYEGLSESFTFELYVESTNKEVDFTSLMGQSVTVTVDMEGASRYFNGIVGNVIQQQTPSETSETATYYRLFLHPSFWLLRFKSNCAIYQNESVMSIVSQLLGQFQVQYKNQTQSRGQAPREYCVQYNETYFDFISRLLEEEGIYYYFVHSDGQHMMVLSDNPQGHQQCEGITSVPIWPNQSDKSFLNVVTRCEVQQNVISNSYSQSDYNFTTASNKIFGQASGESSGGENSLYYFPGDVDHEDKPTSDVVQGYSQMRVEAEELLEKFIEGKSTVPAFSAGFKFSLEDHPRQSANIGYVLRWVKHHYNIEKNVDGERPVYTNTFKAFPDSTPFRPKKNTPIPKIDAQTAVVVGPPGEEIYTDQYGRIKVQFFWDQVGQNNENSSCWLRVRQAWSGNNWGFLFIPRIGQEVIVEFFEGRAHRPFVTGTLYNSTNMPPYLPDRPSKSTIKSNTTKGGGGYNEFRYEDLKGEEQIYLHAQKDWDTLVIETRTTRIQKGTDWKWIEAGDRNVTIMGNDGAVPKTTPADEAQEAGHGDDFLTIIKGSRTMTLKGEGQGKGSYNTYIYKGDRYLKITKGDELEYHLEGRHYKELDQGNYEQKMLDGDKILTIEQGNNYITLNSGNRTTYINGNDSTTIEQNSYLEVIGNLTIIVEGDTTLECAQNISVSAGEDITIEAGGSISITAGESFSVQAGTDSSITAGISISETAGVDIAMDAGADATLNAGAAIEIDAGADIEATAGAAIEITAGADVAIEAAGACEVSAGADVAIEAGGACEITAGGDVSITAACVTIEAAVILLG
ncbi:MAG: type VI secretion system tip protein VgrG [Caedimonadaceae bacterium]|nr:MAG: type VI secretion system tip protein VgrG [Caedimonadaceae bacterium]